MNKTSEEKMTIDLNDPNIKKYLDQISKEYPLRNYNNHQIEQLALRMYLCHNCLKNKKCSYCSCNPIDTISEPYSCNNEVVYPHMLSKAKWNHYKIKHNLLFK